jgi:hypothetical protein
VSALVCQARLAVAVPHDLFHHLEGCLGLRLNARLDDVEGTDWKWEEE